MASGTIRGRNVTLIFLLAVAGGSWFASGRWSKRDNELLGLAQHERLPVKDSLSDLESGIAKICAKKASAHSQPGGRGSGIETTLVWAFLACAPMEPESGHAIESGASVSI
eukprot:1700172-Rhodomonas_salina.2